MILLDTCAIIWDTLAPEKLTKKAKQAISCAAADNEIMVCDISLWEIAMSVKRNRLTINDTATDFINLFLESRNAYVQPITAEIAGLSVNLDHKINKDPADRLIAATSLIYSAPIITSDNTFRKSNILETIW